MLRHASLFSQVLSLVNRHHFASCVKELEAEKHAKGFTCWGQFVAMLFCQLAQAKSLREITQGLQSCEGKLKHLGVLSNPKRSTLSYANARRPWQLYRNVFYSLLERCTAIAPSHKFKFKNKLLSMDATIIDLCQEMFDWARYRQGKGAVKLHMLLDHDGYLPVFVRITEGRDNDLKTLQKMHLGPGTIIVFDRAYTDYLLFERFCREGVFFVTRMKQNAYFTTFKSMEREVPNGSNVLRDETGVFQFLHAGRKVVHKYRKVTVWHEEKKEELDSINLNTIAEIHAV